MCIGNFSSAASNLSYTSTVFYAIEPLISIFQWSDPSFLVPKFLIAWEVTLAEYGGNDALKT